VRAGRARVQTGCTSSISRDIIRAADTGRGQHHDTGKKQMGDGGLPGRRRRRTRKLHQPADASVGPPSEFFARRLDVGGILPGRSPRDLESGKNSTQHGRFSTRCGTIKHPQTPSHESNHASLTSPSPAAAFPRGRVRPGRRQAIHTGATVARPKPGTTRNPLINRDLNNARRPAGRSFTNRWANYDIPDWWADCKKPGGRTSARRSCVDWTGGRSVRSITHNKRRRLCAMWTLTKVHYLSGPLDGFEGAQPRATC